MTDTVADSLTVYAKPGCTASSATYRMLYTVGVRPTQFDKVDISKDPTALAMTVALGFEMTPVVVLKVNGVVTAWCGFKHDLIQDHRPELLNLPFKRQAEAIK